MVFFIKNFKNQTAKIMNGSKRNDSYFELRIKIWIQSGNDPRSCIKNLSGWKRTWKEPQAWPESNPTFQDLDKPTGEQAIVSS